MRLFYASHISAAHMRAYDAWVERLIEALPGTLRSVPRRSQHLTLAFLGEVADREIAGCVGALDALADFGALDYSLGTPRLLVGRGRPRLICVDVGDSAGGISAIQASLTSAVGRLLPSIDTRRKAPHVTIARCNRNLGRSQSSRIAAALGRPYDQPLPASDVLARIQLVRSSLTPGGPIYETLREVRLASSRGASERRKA